MAIRLLKKDEVARQKAEEQRREVAEGLTLARKVDALRELRAKTESEYEKFRDASLASLSKEIGELSQKRDSLQADIKVIEGKLSSLSPEIASERKSLISLKKQLEAKEKEIATKSSELDLKEIDYAELLKETKDSHERQLTLESEANQLRQKASDQHIEASEKLASAKLVEERALKMKKESDEYISLQEASSARREKEVSERETELTKREKENEAEKIRLADQRKTLERALQRIKQNRL